MAVAGGAALYISAKTPLGTTRSVGLRRAFPRKLIQVPVAEVDEFRSDHHRLESQT